MPKRRARPQAVETRDPGLGVILGGVSVPQVLMPDPRVAVERNVAGVVETADRLVRRAVLN